MLIIATTLITVTCKTTSQCPFGEGGLKLYLWIKHDYYLDIKEVSPCVEKAMSNICTYAYVPLH